MDEGDQNAECDATPTVAPLRPDKLRQYIRAGRAPLMMQDGRMGFLTTRGKESHLDLNVEFHEFRQILRSRLAQAIRREATEGLATSAPEESAKRVFSGKRPDQFIFIVAIATALIVAAPQYFAAAFVLLFSLYFFVVAMARCLLMALAHQTSSAATNIEITDADLPTVTILAPLYREAHALPGLTKAIKSLDYPSEKLDVKLLLEEGDNETLKEARRIGLEDLFDIIIVPNSEPQTKPKACNYGLSSAVGDLVVIYDAEDEPEPRQLREAAALFSMSDDALACVQARLNYYNSDDNWLTRLFTLEYCLWFDHFLPALDRLGAPIPLGGTSNIFRTEILAEIGGWDPYNVTEDADLGFRLARRGYRTTVINSTTYEEANCNVGNWMRQRSRWMKGFMQTWIVSRRKANIGRIDWRSFLSIDLFVGGAVFAALANPILLALLMAEKLSGMDSLGALPDWVGAANLGALAFGNLSLIALSALAPVRRNLTQLCPAALLMPIYWLMMSAAAWRGLFQLLSMPSFWEKTEHGLSAEAKLRRTAALTSFGLEQKAGPIQVSGSGTPGMRPWPALENSEPNEPRRHAIQEDERPRQ